MMKTLCDILDLNFPSLGILSIVNILLAVMATAGNLLIIVSVLRSKHLRSQTPTYFIISLALSDLLVGLVVQPLYSIAIIDWSPKTCMIHHYKLGIAFFTCSVSIGNALCVLLARMLRITKPFTYEQYVTKKRALVLCISIWCVGPCIGYMAVLKETELMMAYGAAFEMTASIAIGIYCSSQIYKVGQEQIDRISKNSMGDMKQRLLMERKLTRSLLGVLVAIIVCWIPFAVINIITFHVKDLSNLHLVLTVKFWTILFGYSKSTINIFIFAMTNREIKKAIKNTLAMVDEKQIAQSNALKDYSSSYGTVKETVANSNNGYAKEEHFNQEVCPKEVSQNKLHALFGSAKVASRE